MHALYIVLLLMLKYIMLVDTQVERQDDVDPDNMTYEVCLCNTLEI